MKRSLFPLLLLILFLAPILSCGFRTANDPYPVDLSTETKNEADQPAETALAPEGQPAPSGEAVDGSCPVPQPDEGEISDGEQVDPTLQAPAAPDLLPFVDMSDDEIARLLDEDPAALGPMSVGYTNSGALFNGVAMPEGEHWEIVNASETWGTQETVDFIAAVINKVHAQHPDTPKIYLGDISSKDGGRLNRHLSHQAGRDVDIGWYLQEGQCDWWVVGTQANLDLPRTWSMIRAMFTESDVELILIDKSIQQILYNYALSIGEDRDWLDSVFQHPRGRGYTVIRHARGHKTHVHVRFYNRRAQEMGRRAYKHLIKKKKIKPPTYYAYHKVRKGQTLGHLARRYGTSVKAIKRANGLRSSMIRAGKSYRIPKKGGVKPAPNAVQIPERKIPPPIPGMEDPIDTVPATAIAAVSTNPIPTGDKGKPVAVRQPDMQTEPVVPILESTAPVAAVESAPVVAAAALPPPEPKPKVAKKVKKPSTGKRWVTYRVRSGDNLWTIARRNNIHVKDIKRWNSLKSNKLKPGQKLRLYVRRG